MNLSIKYLLFFLFAFILNQIIYAQQIPKIFINEFLASNVSIDADIVDFDDYSDWIEIYNDENYDVDLTGYYLTDDLKNPTRWKIPAETVINAKGFLRFWADGFDNFPGQTYKRSYYPFDYFTTKYYHLNFKLGRSNEEIGIFNPDTLVVDSITFNLQLQNVSMGRKPDGSSNWFYFGEPTPNSSNSTEGILNTNYSAEPTISLESGVYNSAQNITVTSPNINAVIKYTLDGSDPISSSADYTNPIIIDKNTVLKVRAYNPNNLPSNIISKSYFINDTFSIPIISLSTAPNNLFNNSFGIYNNNFKEREIPISIELIEPNGNMGFNLNAGLRLTGQASLFYPQKSFTISADKKYGSEEIDYKIFKERNNIIFNSIYLRNSGVPDNRSTFFRDALQHSLLINKIDIDCQAYKPSIVFINGNYWGIYNIREKIDNNYLFALHNVNPDNIDLLEYNGTSVPEIMEGDAENYNSFYSFIENSDLTVEQNYNTIKNWMDIDEYINYQIGEIFYDNVFWPEQNMRMWREKKDGAKWRWILHDLDFGFGMQNQRSIGYANNSLKLATSNKINNEFTPPLWSTLIFRKLLSNNEFKIKFIQRFSSYLNSIFHQDTVLSKINELQNVIAPEMSRHINRWRNGEFYYGNPIQNFSEWLNNVNVMKEFAQKRQGFQRQHIIDYFNLSGTAIVNLKFNNEFSGSVQINDVESIGHNSSNTFFKDIPIELKAVPNVGYKFVKWIGVPTEIAGQNPLSILLTSDSLNVSAEFESITVNTIENLISVNTTLTFSNSPYYALGNIVVDSNVTLSIESGVEILLPDNSKILVNGNLIINGTEENPVIIRPNESSKIWGALCIVNSTDSSIIKNLKIIGATKGFDYSRDRAAISTFNSNVHFEGITVDNVQAPIFSQYGNITIKNSKLYTEYSGDLINIKKATYASVENCELIGNDQFDSDGIDFDEISSGLIRNNKIYNVYGFNSDAIDLGEGAKNILIENNIIYNINDKGVSIGNGSSGIIKNNVIANCGMGVGIKDHNSYGYIQNNTFYGNQYGIACFEKNIGEGGGTADVINCIIADSKTSSILVDEISEINISFSLSNTEILTGTNNLNADPKFINDLFLSINSPAINSGDPNSTYDPDGSISDIGAHPFDQNRQIDLIINEIHYHPLNGDDHKFLEVYNRSKFSLNLNNFKISGDINYTFENETIASGEYFIIAKNKNLYEGNNYKVFQWQSGDLKNSLGNVLLWDNKDNVIDFVNYDGKFWWPEEANGKGPSLELQNTSFENMSAQNWKGSGKNGGTPGKSNNSVIFENIFINEFLTSNDSLTKDENNEFDDWIEIFNNNDFPMNIAGMYITDNFNNPCKLQISFNSSETTTIPAKKHILLWADEQAGQGILHLNFKLDKSGEQIGLVQVIDNDTVFVDSLTYRTQSTNISYGRYPDGTDNWKFINVPTPNDSNKIITNINEENILPTSFSLSQNYPNPFNPTTVIEYAIPNLETGNIPLLQLKVFDLLGREVITLVNQKQKSGIYKVEFDASKLSSGVYLYQLKSGSFLQTKKMILLK
ncbi:MAG: CotH kinase family protein [Ignavibacteriales bacterium]|nr:CotH kinase family protein [Ignavibacteriales bacterium]